MRCLSRISSAFKAELARIETLAAIEEIEGELLTLPQSDAKITHRFKEGVYTREMETDGGLYIIGHEHRHGHQNILLTGRIRVFLGNGKVEELTAPAVVMSEAGTRKLAVTLEPVRWLTIHPTKETNIEKLEKQLFKKSKTFLAYEKRKALEAQSPTLLK